MFEIRVIKATWFLKDISSFAIVLDILKPLFLQGKHVFLLGNNSCVHLPLLANWSLYQNFTLLQSKKTFATMKALLKELLVQK